MATTDNKSGSTDNSESTGNKPKAAEKDQQPSFADAGAFNINNQWATSIKYEAKLDSAAQIEALEVKFMNGRKQLAAMEFRGRDEAKAVLGEKNVQNIEAGAGKDKDTPPAAPKGKLQGDQLAYREANTPDYQGNTVTVDAGKSQSAEFDAEVGRWVADRRRQMQASRTRQIQNMRGVEQEGQAQALEGAVLGQERQAGADRAPPASGQEGKAPEGARAGRRDQELAAEVQERNMRLFQAVTQGTEKDREAAHKAAARDDAAAFRQIENEGDRKRAAAAIAHNATSFKAYSAEFLEKAPDAAHGVQLATGKDNVWAQTDMAEAQARMRIVPPSVAKRYVQVDDKFYFQDKTLAFVDKGDKLATSSQNTDVVRTLVAIVKAREWDSITVGGAKEFRRSMWMEGSLDGIEVKGYKPSDIEKAQLAQALAARGKQDQSQDGDQLRNTVAPSPSRGQAVQPGREPGEGSPAAAAPSGKQPEALPSPAKPQGRAPVSGELIEHGAARFEHNPDNKLNYFVKVKTENGEREVWGVDLERAMREAKVQKGDRITLEYKGKEEVVVTAPVRDKDGKVIGEQEILTHRNTWQVEKADAFRNKPREDVVKEHPDLAPAYGTLAAAKKFAEAQWPQDKGMQDRFVATTQSVLADKIERDEKVPAPKLVERVQAQTAERDKTQEREAERVR